MSRIFIRSYAYDSAVPLLACKCTGNPALCYSLVVVVPTEAIRIFERG